MKLKYNIQFFAAGKVCTGFSKPYVANYAANAGVVRYTNARKLARGVSVSMTPDSGGDNDFYTDNQLSESESGAFTSGSVTLTIDGLFIAAERQIMGLPEADASGWTGYGDGQSAPNMGLGFVVRYMSDGVTTYTPVILSKVKFNQVPIAANTAGKTIDWQTEELSAKVMRSDDNNHTWKFIGAEYATEEEWLNASHRIGANLHPLTIEQNAITSFRSSWPLIPCFANTIGPKIIFGSDYCIGGADGVLSRGMQWQGMSFWMTLRHGPTKAITSSRIPTMPGKLFFMEELAGPLCPDTN